MQREDAVYGSINGHIVGIILKEAMRRAIRVIQAHSLVHEVYAKHSEGRPDFFTTGDTDAQKIYVKLLQESFPGFGIVAEEDKLSVPCTLEGVDLYFTVDPLDGTRAYTRKQSHGIGSMAALVRDGLIIGAYVGDTNTGEIYGYRPGSRSVHRIKPNGTAVRLMIDEACPLTEQYILLRDEPSKHSRMVNDLVNARELGKSFEVSGGSIGIHMARLWKGEVGAAILQPGTQKPWDLVPVLGISQKLGFVFIPLDSSRRCIGEGIAYHISREEQMLDREVLVVHRSRYQEAQAAIQHLS